MNSISLFLFLGLVGVARSCSCARRRYNAEVCDDRAKYIIKVKIIEDIEDKDSYDMDKEDDYNSHNWPPLTTSTPATTTTNWYRIRRVRAKILQFYKGKGEIGTEIILASGMMDSLCGIGGWLNPGEKFALSTGSLTEDVQMGLCSFNFRVGGWEWENVEPVLKNHDCDCKLQECRLRVNRKVLRGMCKDTAAYCARDDKGKCRWYNAESISSCRLPPYLRRN